MPWVAGLIIFFIAALAVAVIAMRLRMLRTMNVSAMQVIGTARLKGRGRPTRLAVLFDPRSVGHERTVHVEAGSWEAGTCSSRARRP